MPPSTIQSDKELAIGFQPVLLATFTFRDASVFRICTHPLSASTGVQYDGENYEPRLLSQNLDTIQRLSASGIDLVSSVVLRIADADGFAWVNFETAPGKGFAGAELQLDLVLWEVGTANFSSDSKLKFLGLCEPADSDNAELTVQARNRFDLNKVILPRVRIQKRCPWPFPRTLAERTAAANDTSSKFFACGYSPDVGGGNARGNLDGSEPFTECNFSPENCIARLGNSALPFLPNPPISKDESGRFTGRYGGITYEPPSRRSRAPGQEFEGISGGANLAKYNDFVPVVFGRAWVQPPIMNVNRDAVLTGMEVVLQEGLANGLLDTYRGQTRVVVNDVEMFEGGVGGNPTAGFWNKITTGFREGHPNVTSFYNGRGDPYGSLAAIFIAVPRQLSDSADAPRVDVLFRGREVRVYSDSVTFADEWTDNLAWVLAAVLNYSGLAYDRMDIDSLIAAAAVCAESVDYLDLNGVARSHARFKANQVLRSRRSAADAVRALRSSGRVDLWKNGSTGKLEFHIRQTLAEQQPSPVPGSNYSTAVASFLADGSSASGYVAYRFDKSNIAKINGKLQFKATGQKSNAVPNVLNFSFQDEDNHYLEDSLTLRDVDAVNLSGKEVPASLAIEGIPNYDQGKRVGASLLAEGLRGNPRGDAGGSVEVELETSIKGEHLRIGHIVLVHNDEKPLQAQLESPPATPIDGALFRITAIAPSQNYERIRLTMRWHSDEWYVDAFGQKDDPLHRDQRRNQLARPSFPWLAFEQAPVTGDALYPASRYTFGLEQEYDEAKDGSALAYLRISGKLPVNSFSSITEPPYVPLQGGSGSTGGTIEGGKTYWFALCSKDATGATFKLSAPSQLVKVDVPSGADTNQISIQDISWPDDAVGYQLFGGDHPSRLTFQASADTTPSSLAITSLNTAHYGMPDGEFDILRVKQKTVVHSGDWGLQATSVGSGSLTFSGAGFTTDEWAGRIVTLLAKFPATQPIPVANFLVSANTSEVLTVTPSPLSVGIQVGDVFVMRAKATTVSENTIGDAKFQNSIHPSGLTPNGEIGLVVRILEGTGAGQLRKIKSNTATVYTLERDWDVEPDSDSIWIVEAPEWNGQIETTAIENADPLKRSEFVLPVDNVEGLTLLVAPFTVDGGDNESFAHLGQVREVYVFGDEGAGFGAPTPPGPITGLAVASVAQDTEDPTQVRIRLTYTAPSPLGDFDGVEAQLEAPATGDDPVSYSSGKVYPQGWHRWTANPGEINLRVPYPARAERWYVYGVSRNPSAVADYVHRSGGAPSPFVAVDVPKKPGGGGTVAPNVTGVTAVAGHHVIPRSRASTRRFDVLVNWTLPTGHADYAQLAALRIALVNDSSGIEEYNTGAIAVDRSANLPTSHRTSMFPAPDSVKTLKARVYAINEFGQVSGSPAESSTFVVGPVPDAPWTDTSPSVVVGYAVQGGEPSFRFEMSWTLPSAHADYGEGYHGVEIQARPTGAVGEWSILAIEDDPAIARSTGYFPRPPSDSLWDVRFVPYNPRGQRNLAAAHTVSSITVLAAGAATNVTGFTAQRVTPVKYSADGTELVALQGSWTNPVADPNFDGVDVVAVRSGETHEHWLAIESDGSTSFETAHSPDWFNEGAAQTWNIRAYARNLRGKRTATPPNQNVVVSPTAPGKLDVTRARTDKIGPGIENTGSDLRVRRDRGLVFTGAILEASLGSGNQFIGGQIATNPGQGLELSGSQVRADLGSGLSFSGNDLRVAVLGVVNNMLASGAVTGPKILANSIGAVHAVFQTAAIQNADIANLAVNKLIAGNLTVQVSITTGGSITAQSGSNVARMQPGTLELQGSATTSRMNGGQLSVAANFGAAQVAIANTGYSVSNSSGIVVGRLIATSGFGQVFVYTSGGSLRAQLDQDGLRLTSSSLFIGGVNTIDASRNADFNHCRIRSQPRFDGATSEAFSTSSWIGKIPIYSGGGSFLGWLRYSA